LENGAGAEYSFSGVTLFGHGMGIRWSGSEGVWHYGLATDRILGASRKQSPRPGDDRLEEIPIPPEKVQEWEVEAEFVEAIRSGTPIRFTDFATGVAYMEFTEAVARSAQSGQAVELPLEEFLDVEG